MTKENQEKNAWIVVKIGVSFCFLYAGIAGFMNPQAWIGWFPQFMLDLVSEDIILPVWGVYEIITGVWILSGKKIFTPCVLASLSLAGLIIFNFGAMEVIFRDVTILASTIALAVKYSPSHS